MICPFCAHKTRIYNSRSSHSKTQTWRRHACPACSRTFTTREKIDWSGAVTVVQPPGSSAPYSRERLLLSLVRSSEKLALPTGMLSELADSIELALQTAGFFAKDNPNASAITEVTTTVLRRYDPNLALQYVNNVYANKPPLGLVKQLLEP